MRQFKLDDDDPLVSMLSEFIETIKLDPGLHPHHTQLTYEHFVTFEDAPVIERTVTEVRRAERSRNIAHVW